MGREAQEPAVLMIEVVSGTPVRSMRDKEARGGFMRSIRLVLLATLLTVPLAATAVAQDQYVDDQNNVGVGPAVVPAPVVYGPPVCEWGYYAYYPYACAPYGYYGPNWFNGGVFIGVGPWYHWGWGHGWGRGGYGYRGGYGGRGGYAGGRVAYSGGGYRGGYGGTARAFNGGGRAYPVAPRGGFSGGGHSGGFSGGGHAGGFSGGGHMSGGGGGHMGGGGHR
jgi:hypothetical protein